MAIYPVVQVDEPTETKPWKQCGYGFTKGDRNDLELHNRQIVGYLQIGVVSNIVLIFRE